MDRTSFPHRPLRAALSAVLLAAGLSLAARPSRAQDAQAAVSAAGSATTAGEGGGSTSSSTVRQRPRRSRRRAHRTSRAASAPRWSTPTGTYALASDIGQMLDSRTRSGRWGVMIVSLTRGDTLYSVNADTPLQPASTMKLFTTALALDRLGPNFHLSTDVYRDGPLTPDGTVHGNIYLRGGGDPAFSNRFLEGDPNAPTELLARFVAGAGVKRVTGDLIADASAFDGQKVPDGWLSRYLQSSYAARVSALSLNENLVWVVVSPGAGHANARVELEPSTSTIPVTSHVRTVPGSRGARVRVIRTSDGNIEARGWIGSLSIPRRYELVVEDPALFAAGAFRNALAELGVTVQGSVRTGVTPPGAAKVSALPSPPLARLVAVMNRESINHYAELLFRDAVRGRADTGVASVASGYALMEQFLKNDVGIDPGSVYMTDGSGLSSLDRITPRALVSLLSYAHHAPWSSTFHASLPVAGESELLAHRMKYTPAQGNLHAKTGTTNTVIALGGYVTARDGEVLAFAFIYNGTDRWNAKSTIDQMGATLASFARD